MEKSRENNIKYIWCCLFINSCEKAPWENIHKRLSRTIIWSVDHNGNNLPKRPMGKIWGIMYIFSKTLCRKVEDVTYYMSWISLMRKIRTCGIFFNWYCIIKNVARSCITCSRISPHESWVVFIRYLHSFWQNSCRNRIWWHLYDK